MTHRWHFFRAGGVDQVSLRDKDDLRALATLDQKLWVALAMPVKDVDVDPKTLELIDTSHDGRIRVPDVLATIMWADLTFKDLDVVLSGSDKLELAQIKDDKVVTAAKRMLADLGRPNASAITVGDTTEITKVFESTVLNGDGIVIPASSDEAELTRVIEDVIATAGSVTDRSGKPGIDQAHADTFFKAVDERVAWIRKGTDAAMLPIGEGTAAASTALGAVRDKLEDYFTRARVAAFDPRGATTLGISDAELTALATRALTVGDEELAKLPLAQIDPAGRLVFARVNPAWRSKIDAFSTGAVTPLLGARDAITHDEMGSITGKLAAYDAWHAAEPKTIVDKLDPAWLHTLAEPTLRDRLKALIARDAELGHAYDQITSVAKAVRLQRDFGRLLRNFVNFTDFYGKQDGVFQAGVLYLDARALKLTVPVDDVAKHAVLAASSDSYLLYCDLVREDNKRSICAAVTNGDGENLFVGRNGIFYDREGRDWDATVTKVIGNPISIREAFWTPYKKLVKVIEDNVTKRAAAADAAANDKLAATASTEKKEPAKKIDLGTVAALGVAIGGIGTLLGALLATIFGLGPWLPLGILAIMLLISGPAMLLAYLKLRRRNLGPILDANGWAINNRAKINVAFGAAMTELAKLPPGSHRAMNDPFADRKTPLKLYTTLILIIVLLGSWYVGKLDPYLPQQIRSVTLLGTHAPAYEAPPIKLPIPGLGSGSATKP